MNVLSLFDGISCARAGLERANIPVATYYASEIDKHAIAVSQANYPDIVRLGDVRQITELPVRIDLLIGGSPCTDLSIAKKDRQGLAGSQSSLFWEYVRLWKALTPKYFVLENVASMPKADRDTITKELGVEPVLFDASLVSAQCRKRLFWTNLTFDLPADRGILLKDILQPDAEVDPTMVVNGKSFCLTASYSKGGEGQSEYEHNKARKQRTMVKLGPLGTAKTGLHWIPSPYLIHTPDGSSTAEIRVGHEQRRKLKNGKRADDDPTIEAIRRIETRNDDKCGTLTTVLKDNHIVDVPTHRIRKLTPIECERLQGLPDNYTAMISKTQRYKCLGNAFNVDVIAHIIRHLNSHTPHHKSPGGALSQSSHSASPPQ